MIFSGKFLGIDYGTKRIGVAISDENGTLAFPKEIILNDKNTFPKLAEIIKKENITEIVIGDSRNANNAPNKVNLQIENFILELAKNFGLKVNKEKEFFTSFEAHSRMGKETNNARKQKFVKVGGIDALAAALILQRYLDRLRQAER